MTAPKKQQSKKNGGRPTKLTEEISDLIVSAIRAGCYVETAAAHAGVSRRVVNQWMKRGRDEIDRRNKYEQERGTRKNKTAGLRQLEKENKEKSVSEQCFVDFVESMEKAVADSELSNLMVIHKAANGGQVLKRVTVHKADGSKEVQETLSRPEWTAAAWRLERRAPERWGKRQVDVQLSGAVDVNDTANVARDRLLSSLMRMAGAAEQVAVESENENDDLELKDDA